MKSENKLYMWYFLSKEVIQLFLVVENIITDLRKAGIHITQKVFDYLNEFIDIQNSNVEKLDIASWRDLKGKTVLVVQDKDIIAVYGDGKFMYNPNKIKSSEVPDYDVYEVLIGGVHVQNRRQQRRDYLSGLVKTNDVAYYNTPSSSTYIWDKDWNTEVNKVYYSKLLQRNHLGKYAEQLDDAYDVVKELIDQRKDRLTGKRTEYDRMITGISKQIGKIEDEMIAAERDFSFDVDKLKKELSKLPRLIKDAKDFIDTENKEFAIAAKFNGTGKRKPIPYDIIKK